MAAIKTFTMHVKHRPLGRSIGRTRCARPARLACRPLPGWAMPLLLELHMRRALGRRDVQRVKVGAQKNMAKFREAFPRKGD